MRKAIAIAALAVAVSVSAVACSGETVETATNQAETQTQQQEQSDVIDGQAEESDSTSENRQQSDVPASVEVGEPISVSMGDGDLVITIEGFEDSQEAYDYYSEYGDIDEEMRMAFLLMRVENISYEANEYGTLFLDGIIYVEDSDGVTINPLNGGWDYGQYKVAPGYAFDCQVGQTKRVAVPFQVPEGTSSVTAVVDGTRVSIPVTEGR